MPSCVPFGTDGIPAIAGVKNPLTVPESENVPSGFVNVVGASGMSQVTVPFAWLCFADVSVSLSVDQ